MIQITARSATGESISIHVDKDVKIIVHSDERDFVITLTQSEWDLINQFVFDQTKTMKK